MREFKLNTSQKDRTLTVEPVGSMNENATFPDMDASQIDEVVVNFEYTDLINSTGILKWTKWVSDTLSRKPEIRFQFANCTHVVIDQMNRVKGFLPPNSRIVSFYLPFYCEQCDRGDYRPMGLGRDFYEGTENEPGKVDSPEMNCFTCKQAMEIDFNPESFYKFLSPQLAKKA